LDSRGKGPVEQPPGQTGPPQSGASVGRIVIWIIALVVLLPLVMQLLGVGPGVDPQISYTQFRKQLADSNITSVTVKGQKITGKLTKPTELEIDGKKVKVTEFVTYLPSFGDSQLLHLLDQHGVRLETEPTGGGIPWLSIIIFLGIPLVLFLWLGRGLASRMRQQGQQMFSIAGSRAKLYERSKGGTTFDDVAGAEGAKTELREIIDYLRDPGRFRTLGGEPPRGVLLVGPPGTGKTLLARATAGEADVPFFSITGSDFMEMFVGVGASRVRAMFSDARKAAPCLIFIDELDSVGRQRGAGLGGGHDEREQTLNQLLSEMDGFEPHAGIVMIAATNRPDILDSALLRPGRFDRRITVDLPSASARTAILRVHARNKPLADSVDLAEVARSTPGFSGADLANLLNEAALLAARKGKNVIEKEDVEAARDKILLGLEREGVVLTREECRLLAYHEGGHAVIAAMLPNADPLHKVSIVPRGRAMGVTQQLPERDRYVFSREYLIDRLAVMLGGRAAEQMVLNTATSGAEQDLKEAARLARKMVLDWGMSERLGHLALGGAREHVFLGEEIGERRQYSEVTAREVDEEIRAVVDQAYKRAEKTLREHRDGLDRVADALLEHEEIPGDKVLELLGMKAKGRGAGRGERGEGPAPAGRGPGTGDRRPKEPGAKAQAEESTA
jgi:cell division protease FtsH